MPPSPRQHDSYGGRIVGSEMAVPIGALSTEYHLLADSPTLSLRPDGATAPRPQHLLDELLAVPDRLVH